MLVPYEGEDGNGSVDERVTDSDDGSASPEPGPKKWFQRDSDDDAAGSRKRRRTADEVDTLEDLEALATSYL